MFGYSAGIKACKPGGIIVYSTCTLSLPQNDGAVQAALEKICQETNIEVAIEDTGMIADHFRQTFNFYGKCRYGQLVVPNLTANFGPTYFCKLHRIKQLKYKVLTDILKNCEAVKIKVKKKVM